MSKKFWFLVKQSLRKKMKTKTFIIVNILLLIVFAALMNIDRIILFFGGSFTNPLLSCLILYLIYEFDNLFQII